MADYQFIQIERDDGCATLWLNRPERRNALHGPMVVELQRGIDELSQDAAVRVIVLAGRGACFCAGADLDWTRRQAAAPFDLNLEDARQLAYTLRSLALCRKPTLARVHGVAFGGALGLICACDIALATRATVFAASEARHGLTPSTTAPYVIAAIGERAARYCFLTGERFDGVQAQRLGLVHEAVDEQVLGERLRQLIEALRLGAPQAQTHCKWLLSELHGRVPANERIEETARSLASVRAGDEAGEGLEAFFGRRKPAWAP